MRVRDSGRVQARDCGARARPSDFASGLICLSLLVDRLRGKPPCRRNIDFLLTGLPEKEALGPNVIEAQACGTPVLARDAPPFDETVMHGATGLRYRNPREDGGAGFERTLRLALGGGFRFDAESAKAHLAQFSEGAFVERVRGLVKALRLAPVAAKSIAGSS